MIKFLQRLDVEMTNLCICYGHIGWRRSRVYNAGTDVLVDPHDLLLLVGARVGHQSV